MKIKRSTLVPVILAAYLAAMAAIGWKDYQCGRTSALMYFGVIAITLVLIVLLHFNLKRREQLRREREEDLKRNEK